MQTLHDFIKIADQFSINALIFFLNVNFFSIFTNRIYSLTTYSTKLGHSVVKYAKYMQIFIRVSLTTGSNNFQWSLNCKLI